VPFNDSNISPPDTSPARRFRANKRQRVFAKVALQPETRLRRNRGQRAPTA